MAIGLTKLTKLPTVHLLCNFHMQNIILLLSSSSKYQQDQNLQLSKA